MITIKFSNRQEELIRLVKQSEPITSENLAKKLNLTRAALRSDLAVLTMMGVLEARPKVGYFYSQKCDINVISDYIKNIKVADIKSKPVIVDEDTTVYDSIIQLFLSDTGTLFVTNNDSLVGTASRKDFLKIAMGNTDIHHVPVGIIMTRMPNIITVIDDDSAYDAAKKIIEHEVDCLPVIEKVLGSDMKESYKITGKVSKTNITKLFLRFGTNSK